MKFLIFREDNPTHQTWSDFKPWHLALFVPSFVLLSGSIMIYLYVSFGFWATIAWYIADVCLPLEILHIIFDR